MPERNRRHDQRVPPEMKTRSWCVASFVLGVLIAACTAATPSATPEPEPFEANGDWVLESGTVDDVPIPIIPDYPVTLSFDGLRVGGRAPCNGYGGRLQVVDGGIRVTELGVEQVLCGGDPNGEVMQAETAFLRGLEAIRAMRGQGDRMTLVGPTVELVFARQPPMPIEAIVDTDWILETRIDGEVERGAVGPPATLRIDRDGTFGGTTGCRTFTGSWIQAAGRLTATQMSMDGECPDGLGGQDSAVTEVLEGTLATIDGDRLTLTKSGGRALVYRRAND
jgi:heat shock protein HslJ